MTLVAFNQPDGEKDFPRLLGFVDLYTKVSNAQVSKIDRKKMEEVFGKGKRRPLVHEDTHSPVYVWRFKQGNTFLRVETIPPGPGIDISSCVRVEAPQGLNESMGDETIRADVAEFMAALTTALA